MATKETFIQLFDSLTPKEIQILSRRFGLDGLEPGTLEEIGNNLGVTRERIRQIEAKAIQKLRRNAGRYDINIEEFV